MFGIYCILEVEKIWKVLFLMLEKRVENEG